jgi:Cu/Zn superoxide dismutase
MKNQIVQLPTGSAGGHWNPTFKKHGKWGVGEYHKGDRETLLLMLTVTEQSLNYR